MEEPQPSQSSRVGVAPSQRRIRQVPGAAMNPCGDIGKGSQVCPPPPQPPVSMSPSTLTAPRARGCPGFVGKQPGEDLPSPGPGRGRRADTAQRFPGMLCLAGACCGPHDRSRSGSSTGKAVSENGRLALLGKLKFLSAVLTLGAEVMVGAQTYGPDASLALSLARHYLSFGMSSRRLPPTASPSTAPPAGTG